MPRRPSLEAELAALSQNVRSEADPDARGARLRDGLASRRAPVIARAAALAGEHDAAELAPELEAALLRLLDAPAKSDPSCMAKLALAETLQQLGAEAGEAFRRGAVHVQHEPVWGGRADTAGPLRAACARGLVRIADPERYALLAERLADPEPGVRLAAVRALLHDGGEGAVPLLRLRAAIGDEPELTGECLAAWLALDPDAGPGLTERLLGAEPELAEAALAALADGRSATAVEVLDAVRARTRDPARRRAALTALAATRRDEALERVLALVAEGTGPDARAALRALAERRHEPGLAARVEATVDARDDLDLRADFASSFSGTI